MWIAALFFAASAAPADYEACSLRSGQLPETISAQCFEVSVPLDWSQPDGETIQLAAAWIAPRAGEAEGEPLLMLAGGPGQAALEAFIPHVRALGAVRQNHPIVLVDQRGTGGSARLECPDAGLAEAESAEEIGQAMQRCREALDRDPRHFTTQASAKDLDAVREHLGIEEWHVYGVSYGSRLGLHYLRRFEERVASLILDGVVPADEVLGPMLAPFAERAVKRMLQRCESSEDCREAFPDLEEGLRSLLESVAEEEREVSIRHPRSHEWTEVALNRQRIGQLLRFAAYQPDVLAIMPLLIHRAAREDDWAPLAAQWVTLGESLEGSLSIPLHYAVVCSEDISFIDEDSPFSEEDGLLGLNPLALLQAACAEWPRADIPADFHQAVASERPVLLLSGELDPVTPPEWGDQAAATLDNSRHVILKGKGHNVIHHGCLPFLVRDFLRNRDPAGLDSDCLSAMRPMPFFLDFSGPAP
ncbi:alpha/beta hydrolase [Natronospira sp.]|uniref:alpha/beta hydrolase n=1 Tax=Natronospira sp. TaxID=2024970 RepID=UPI003872E2E2